MAAGMGFAPPPVAPDRTPEQGHDQSPWQTLQILTAMKKLNKIAVFSFARFQAWLCALVGVACGLLYSIGGLILDTLVSLGWLPSASMSTPGLSPGTVLAFGALIGIPILFAITGFLGGILEAVLYNLFARWFGGLTVDFAKTD